MGRINRTQYALIGHRRPWPSSTIFDRLIAWSFHYNWQMVELLVSHQHDRQLRPSRPGQQNLPDATVPHRAPVHLDWLDVLRHSLRDAQWPPTPRNV